MAESIIVADYDSCWLERFQFLRTRVAEAFGSMVVAIEHVRSTAVPNLAAKPIIDIDVLLAMVTELPAAIDCLAKLGYVHQGNLGIPDRKLSLRQLRMSHITSMFARQEAKRFKSIWRLEIISAPIPKRRRNMPI